MSVDSLDKALSVWEGEDMSVDLVTDIEDGDVDEEVCFSFEPITLGFLC